MNCPGDVVIDWRNEVPLCRNQQFLTNQAPVSGDVCPGEFWVEIDHAQALLDPSLVGTFAPVTINVASSATPEPSTTPACSATLAQLDPWVPDPNHPGRFLPEGRKTVAGSIVPIFGCLTSVERDWSTSDFRAQSGVDTLRFMISPTPVTVNGATTTVPQQVTVGESCVPKGMT